VPTAVADVARSPDHSGRRTVLNASLAVCLSLAALSGPVAWYFYIEFQFFGAHAEPADYQGAITAYIVTAALLALGAVAVLALRAHWANHAIVVAGVLLQIYLTGTAYAGATAAPDRDVSPYAEYSLQESILFGLFVVPTSWPLEILLLGLLVHPLRALLRALRALLRRVPPRPLDR